MSPVARPAVDPPPLTPTTAAVTPPPTAAPNMKSMDRALLRGIAWTGSVKWLHQVLSWALTLVVARLLSESDYGIAGMATAYIGLVQLMSEFGLSAAVVQQRDLTDDQVAQLGTLSVALGVLFAAVSLAAAGPVAIFFREPKLRLVVVVLSTTFVVSGLQVLPRSLLARDLRFRVLALIDGLESVTLTATTVTLAFLGGGYWALVLGGLVSRTVATIALLAMRWHRLAVPSLRVSVRTPVVFGANVLIGNVAWYAFRSADMTIVGRTLGTAALGAYTIGFSLAAIPVDRVTGLISRATPAVLAAVQHDAAALRRYLLALVEGVAIVTMPIAVGVALVAREFTIVVLGAKWLPAVGALRLLALAAVIRSLVPLTNQVLIAKGDARRSMRGTVVMSLVLPPIFWLGSSGGIEGVAAVWLAAYPIVAAAAITRYALASIDTSWPQVLRSLGPASAACAAMAAVVLTLGAVMPRTWGPAIALALKVIAGAATYAGTLYATHGARLRGFVGLLRGTAPQVA